MTDTPHRILAASRVRLWSGISPDLPALKQVEDIVRWKIRPPFTRRGRGVWVDLDTPIRVKTQHREIEIVQLKIKGIGVKDFAGRLAQPNGEPFRNVQPHLGITQGGGLEIVPGGVGPTGALRLSRAEREFDASDRLLQAGVPSQVPLAVYRYDDPGMTYREKNGSQSAFGVVVCGLPVRGFDRASRVLSYRKLAPADKARIEAFAQRIGLDLGDDPETALYAAINGLYADAIRGFAATGLYRHSAHFSNIGLAWATGGIYFTDLDSIQQLAETSDAARPLQVVRDVMSPILHTIGTFTELDQIDEFTPDRVERHDVFGPYLRTYFRGVPDRVIEGCCRILESYSRSFYAHETDPAEKRRRMVFDESASYQARYDQHWQRTETPYPELFAQCFAVALFLHRRSESGQLYPVETPDASLYADMEAFTSPQFVSRIRAELDAI